MDIKIPVALEEGLTKFVAEQKSSAIAKLSIQLAQGMIKQATYDELVAKINATTPEEQLTNMLRDTLVNWKRQKIVQTKKEEIDTEVKAFETSIS